MKDAVASEADAFMAMIERAEGKRFRLLRIAAQDGVAVAFYRRIDGTDSDGRSLFAVVLDEEEPEQWEALGASEVRTGGSRHISARPSERGDWIVAIYGSAPTRARVAAVDDGGFSHRVAVEDGVYAFMSRAATEPEPTLAKPRFE
jgi:hypothetical protein